ncbi:hypothetical protein FQP88_14315 [Vibrio atlanticus]|nr:hypothetical protein FQP88_14315 [Vibrio atlanticus]
MNFGGFNQLELENVNANLHPDSYRFQSARAALYAYCDIEKLKKIYLPNYICDSILPALYFLGISVEFYSIDKNLLPNKLPEIERDELSKIVIVNYFGLLNEEIRTITSLRPEDFIVDNSQALFCNHLKGTTSIYSPRKFLGIPDGGFLITSSDINMELEEFDSSHFVSHLLLRSAGCVSKGYLEFLKAEESLECFLPKKLSSISEYLIKCSDINRVKEKRRENFVIINDFFKEINEIQLPLNNCIPLCYPLTLSFDVSVLCNDLINSGVFLPRYWSSQNNGNVGETMYGKTLFIPIDERLSVTDIELLAKLIKEKVLNEYSR